MIQYRVKFLTGGYDCSVSGNQLFIGLDEGDASFLQGANFLDIGPIEVYVSGDDSQFQIVGLELSREETNVGAVTELSVPTNDPGNFIGWTRGEIGQYKTLVLDFEAPRANGSEHMWVFGVGTPPLKLTVKVKRQESPNTTSCTNWPAILPPPPT